MSFMLNWSNHYRFTLQISYCVSTLDFFSFLFDEFQMAKLYFFLYVVRIQNLVEDGANRILLISSLFVWNKNRKRRNQTKYAYWEQYGRGCIQIKFIIFDANRILYYWYSIYIVIPHLELLNFVRFQFFSYSVLFRIGNSELKFKFCFLINFQFHFCHFLSHIRFCCSFWLNSFDLLLNRKTYLIWHIWQASTNWISKRK